MKTARAAQDEVLVRLSYDEALVLSDLLDRWCQAGRGHAIQLDDPGEIRLVDDLCASFEPVIDEVFSDDYGRILDAARRRIAADTSAD